MEEMLEDTLDIEDDEELEEEADAEVDKVLYDLTNGKLGEVGSVRTDLPVRLLFRSGAVYRLTITPDPRGQARRRGDREDHGEVPPAT